MQTRGQPTLMLTATRASARLPQTITSAISASRREKRIFFMVGNVLKVKRKNNIERPFT